MTSNIYFKHSNNVIPAFQSNSTCTGLMLSPTIWCDCGNTAIEFNSVFTSPSGLEANASVGQRARLHGATCNGLRVKDVVDVADIVRDGGKVEAAAPNAIDHILELMCFGGIKRDNCIEHSIVFQIWLHDDRLFPLVKATGEDDLIASVLPRKFVEDKRVAVFAIAQGATLHARILALIGHARPRPLRHHWSSQLILLYASSYDKSFNLKVENQGAVLKRAFFVPTATSDLSKACEMP